MQNPSLRRKIYISKNKCYDLILVKSLSGAGMGIKNLLFFAFVCLLLIASADSASAFGHDDDRNVFQRAFDMILGIFSLDFLKDEQGEIQGWAMFAFVKIILGIIVFAVLYNVALKVIPTTRKGIPLVVALGFALITTLFIPDGMIKYLIIAYTTVLVALLFGGLLLFVFVISWQYLPEYLEGPALTIARILVVFLLIIILTVIISAFSVSDNIFFPFFPRFVPF